MACYHALVKGAAAFTAALRNCIAAAAASNRCILRYCCCRVVWRQLLVQQRRDVGVAWQLLSMHVVATALGAAATVVLQRRSSSGRHCWLQGRLIIRNCSILFGAIIAIIFLFAFIASQ